MYSNIQVPSLFFSCRNIFGAWSLIVGMGIGRFMYDGANISYQEVSESGDNGGSMTSVGAEA